MQKLWKQRLSKKLFMHCFISKTKRVIPGENLDNKGEEFAEELLKISAAEGIQIYSKMNEATTELVEHSIRSFKNTFHLYMENYG